MSQDRWEERWLDGSKDPATAELRRALDEARLRGPDDVTVRRMWGRVSEPGPVRRRRAPRWLWFVSGVGSTAALSFAFAAWMWPQAQMPAPAIAVSAAAPAIAPESAPDAGPTVVAPATVRTGAGETLRLTLQGGAAAQLASSSVMSLIPDAPPAVEGGEVGFSVPHQAPGHSFVIQAAGYRVVVVGTKFKVGVDERRRVSLSVDEGVVEVWERDRVARLTAGQSWHSPEEENTGAAEGAGSVGPPKDATPSAKVHVARDVRPARVPARQAGRGRELALANPGVPAPAAPPVAVAAVSGAAETATPAARPPAAAPDLAGQARGALAAGDVPRALALYRAAAQRGGPAGENAEYEIGKILRDRLGQPANAVAAWRRYRTEHPDGILRAEADVSIIETLVHSGDADGALAESNDFLRRHPDSERRAEMARVAGDLYRTRGDCARAVPAYETALAAPHARDVAEAATFHRAACLVQLGDPAGAAAARSYLRAWPNGRFHKQAAQLVAVSTGDEAASP